VSRRRAGLSRSSIGGTRPRRGAPFTRSDATGAGGPCGPTWAIRDGTPAERTAFTVSGPTAKIVLKSNRAGDPHPSKVRGTLRSETMLLQENICSSRCQRGSTPRFFLCCSCRRQVVICNQCDRGQVYCGRDCALEVRRRRQREARRRYQASERGRQLHADRSRRFRARGRRVTDQGPTLATRGHQQPEPAHAAVAAAQVAIVNATGRLTACHRCGHPVPDRVRMGPIHRPRRRVITLHSDPRHKNVGRKLRIQSGANIIAFLSHVTPFRRRSRHVCVLISARRAAGGRC
jgi:hypothetical protein